jgi:hypothetical protein
VNGKELITEMLNTQPLFRPPEDWVEDGLLYLIASDFGRHICQAAQENRLDEVNAAVALLERALREGDDYVRDCIYDGAAKLNVCDSAAIIKDYLGPEMRSLWNTRENMGWR